MKLHRRHLLAASPLLVLQPALARMPWSDVITVVAANGAATGLLYFYGGEYPCALGRAGIVADKREGDGGTPAGDFPLRQIRYRPDRLPPPHSALPVVKTNPADGWCDAAADPAYNRPVRLPYRASAEVMWRDDGAYDLVAVIGYNDAPVVPGKGSAIFLHVARTAPDGAFLPTAGCVALRREDLVAVLANARPETRIAITLE